MAKSHKPASNVGYGKPPRDMRFKPGQSGNPNGRPKGTKNLATILEEELNNPVSLTENGKRKKISKGRVITKQAVNQAAGGDLKAIQTVFNQARLHERAAGAREGTAVFDTYEDAQVLAEAIRRIRLGEGGDPLMGTTRTVPSKCNDGTSDVPIGQGKIV